MWDFRKKLHSRDWIRQKSELLLIGRVIFCQLIIRVESFAEVSHDHFYENYILQQGKYAS